MSGVLLVRDAGKRRVIVTLLIFILSLFATPLLAQPSAAVAESETAQSNGDIPAEPVEQPLEKVDAFVLSEMERQKLVGLGIGLLKNGRIIYLRGYGWEDREAKTPVEASRTMFRWASISKTLTGIVGAKLAQQEVLDLDAPISKYTTDYATPGTYLRSCKDEEEPKQQAPPCQEGFREFPLDSGQVITPRLLLGNLAGVPHYRNGRGTPQPPNSEITDPEINRGFSWALRHLADKPLVSVPGQEHHYSTFGFNAAGAVLAGAAGRPFPELVNDMIAKPLGLDSLQPDYEFKEISRRAVGYWQAVFQKDKPGRILRQGSLDVSWKLPGGGFISTVRDLARYCQGLMGSELLDPELKKMLWTSQKDGEGKETNYGMGFGTRTNEFGWEVSHGGSQQKTRTFLVFYPETGTGLVLMSNSVYLNIPTLARGLIELLLEEG